MRKDSAFTLVELLVVIAIIGILVALLLPAVQAAREAARRTQCVNNQKQLLLGLVNYESARRELPPAFQYADTQNPAITKLPGINWVISILPFIEQQTLYDSFVFLKKPDGSDDLKQNLRAKENEGPRSQLLSMMLCPSDDYNQQPLNTEPAISKSGKVFFLGDNWARGNYACNAGNGPMIKDHEFGIAGPDSEGWSGPKSYLRRGVMGPNVAVSLEAITDGLTNTMMLAEIRAGLTEKDRRGTWALGSAGASVVVWHGYGGDANGPNACFRYADDVEGCEASLQNEYQRQCMSCNTNDNWNDQAAPRSSHPGGLHIGLADGSVRFINDSIETTGSYGPCCSAWDYFILSADGELFDSID